MPTGSPSTRARRCPRSFRHRGRSTRTATCSARATSSPTPPSASTPRRRRQGRAVEAARPPRLRPQRRRPGHLPRGRQLRDGRRAAALRRSRAGRRHDPARRRRRRAARHARGRRTWSAVQLRQAARRPQARRLLPRAGRADRAARLARRRLLRGSRPRRAVEPVHLARRAGRRRPHGPPRRRQAGRGRGVRPVPAFMDASGNVWCKVSCPERLSLEGRRTTSDVGPSRARWSSAFATGSCGAPTGRTPT